MVVQKDSCQNNQTHQSLTACSTINYMRLQNERAQLPNIIATFILLQRDWSQRQQVK